MRSNGKSSRPTFMNYMLMGFGFATGAAAASILVTLATLGVREIHHLVLAKGDQVYMPGGDQTRYVNAPSQNTVTGG